MATESGLLPYNLIIQHSRTECRLSPPSALQEYLVEGSNLLADLQPEFLNTTSHFEQVCGEVNNTNWQDSARTTSNLLCSVSDTVSELRDLFECPNWYPLYESTVHDTFCYSVDSLSWIAFTQFFVMCLAMIVITCRASIFQRIEIEQVGVADSTGLKEAGDDHGFEDEPSPAGRIEWAVPVGAFYNEDDDDDTIIAAWQTETDVGEVAISSSSSSPEDGGMDPETTEDPCWKPVEVYEA